MAEIINEYNLITSEKYFDLIQKVSNLNQKVWEVAKPRYQFNLKIDKNKNLKTFNGKELFFYNAINADNFCFRPVFYIKRELYDLLKQLVKDNVKIGLGSLNLKYFKEKNVFFYNATSIYDKIDIVKTDHCKVMAYFDNILVEIPPIGTSINGLPFFEDKQPDESQTSGWWIEGNSIRYFINTFASGFPKEIKVKVYYYKKG